MAMNGRAQPLTLYGPRPFIELPALIGVGPPDLTYELALRGLADGERVERATYAIRAVAVDHRVPALGYVLEEPPRPGAFLVDRAQALGIPQGPLFHRLQGGEAVTLADGRTIQPSDVLGPPRRGRKVVFSGDTRPCPALEQAAEGADLLIHDGTFASVDQARAVETGHSTAEEAGRLAARAGVRELVLTHVSSRYDGAPAHLGEEASAVFGGVVTVAEDGLTREIGITENRQTAAPRPTA
jgi:ribonuclease Z